MTNLLTLLGLISLLSSCGNIIDPLIEKNSPTSIDKFIDIDKGLTSQDISGLWVSETKDADLDFDIENVISNIQSLEFDNTPKQDFDSLLSLNECAQVYQAYLLNKVKSIKVKFLLKMQNKQYQLHALGEFAVEGDKTYKCIYDNDTATVAKEPIGQGPYSQFKDFIVLDDMQLPLGIKSHTSSKLILEQIQ